jgi:NAD(P)-dependent dehydrogenase (short-subunit alcohol dehydrogenase family)
LRSSRAELRVSESAQSKLRGGWTVWAFDLSDDSLASFKDADHIDRCRYQVCDVRSEESLKAAFAAVTRETDGIRAIVCSVGITRLGPVEKAILAKVDLLFDVNVRGP